LLGCRLTRKEYRDQMTVRLATSSCTMLRAGFSLIRLRWFVIALCGLARMPAATEAQTAGAPVTIIRAVHLLDGRGGGAVTSAMVRVEGEKIAEVGTSLSIPPGAKVIDLGDATWLPGLIDLHTHLTSRMGVHWEDALAKTTPGHDALWGARNALVTLRAGFTTCREM